jgi:hypothetical protein
MRRGRYLQTAGEGTADTPAHRHQCLSLESNRAQGPTRQDRPCSRAAESAMYCCKPRWQVTGPHQGRRFVACAGGAVHGYDVGPRAAPGVALGARKGRGAGQKRQGQRRTSHRVLKSECSGGVLRRSFCRRSLGVHNEVSSLRGTLRGLNLRLPSNRHSAQYSLCLSLVKTEHGHKAVDSASAHGVWLRNFAYGEEAYARRLHLALLFQLLCTFNRVKQLSACRQQGRSRDGCGCAGQQRQGGGRAERRRRAPAREPRGGGRTQAPRSEQWRAGCTQARQGWQARRALAQAEAAESAGAREGAHACIFRALI